MVYTWVDNDRFLEHNKVEVFHLYRNDFDTCKREFLFTIDEMGGEDDDGRFDIRDLPNPNGLDLCNDPGAKQIVIKEAIDSNELLVDYKDEKLTPQEFFERSLGGE